MGHHVVGTMQEKGKGKDDVHLITIVNILRTPQSHYIKYLMTQS